MEERYARTILSDFPYPIAKQFIKLRTDECMDPGHLRLKYILATGEALSRLLGIVVLCECRKFLESKEISVPKSIYSEFERGFKRPSWGFWTMIAREGLKFLSKHDIQLAIQELKDFFFKNKTTESNAVEALGKLLSLRNGLSHDRIKAMRSTEFRVLCEEYYPLLCRVLEDADFLLGYELAFFSRIEVNKGRRTPPDYVHRFKRISGISGDFLGGKNRLPETLQSHAIMLVSHRKISKCPSSLSLDPLYVYEEDAGEAPDVYYFNGMNRPEKAEFIPCSRRGNFKAEESKRGGIISEELAHIVELFTASQEDLHVDRESTE